MLFFHYKQLKLTEFLTMAGAAGSGSERLTSGFMLSNFTVLVQSCRSHQCHDQLQQADVSGEKAVINLLNTT